MTEHQSAAFHRTAGLVPSRHYKCFEEHRRQTLDHSPSVLEAVDHHTVVAAVHHRAAERELRSPEREHHSLAQGLHSPVVEAVVELHRIAKARHIPVGHHMEMLGQLVGRKGNSSTDDFFELFKVQGPLNLMITRP